MAVKSVTDSTADLPPELIKLGVHGGPRVLAIAFRREETEP
jgi:fatty acid-binding protein DegV